MAPLASNLVILAASLVLAACGGASPISPLASQDALGVAGSTHQLADAAARRRVIKLAQSRIKHVFVLVQENHTFDQIYGLYPGVNGQYVNNLGTIQAQESDCQPDPVAGDCQRPFLISANQGSASYVPDAPDISGG